MTGICSILASTYETWLASSLEAEFQSRNWEMPRIQIGRLLEDPTRPGVSLLVYINDPEDDQYRHEAAGKESTRRDGVYYDYEYGYITPLGTTGGRTWKRRFRLRLRMFFVRTGENRDDAREKAELIMRMSEDIICNYSVRGTTDELGEEAIEVHLIESRERERGGERSWIWDGDIWFVVITERQACN